MLLKKSFAYRAFKRTMDFVLSFLVLFLMSPLLLVVAVCIKLDSPGPILYRGVRTGKGGVPFHLLKFRTMVANAEKVGGPSTGKGDPRITRMGKLLRKYKIDELPNLFNVLKGNMSLVGPRPEVPKYTALYRDEELLILQVPPGITDFSSIEFIALDEALGSVDVDRVYEEKIKPVKNKLRIKYAKEASLVTDFRILFLTVFRLVRK